jgi:hypothetical protein
MDGEGGFPAARGSLVVCASTTPVHASSIAAIIVSSIKNLLCPGTFLIKLSSSVSAYKALSTCRCAFRLSQYGTATIGPRYALRIAQWGDLSLVQMV